ncbi:1-(5-phosphoribosyl)-5-((5-phosphoribosylamino)methylideneamino)imidazole-4-carboxamide isomerase [Sulfolobus acidocaldarius]|uniref:1-(5-phosphoribosyl)-5-[(5-phosphoribosylamino)methylideneamino] imidazole-4-carboxamide isomerase n=4 Tax=Sulfolobus acidocaldarius TaxID=2285 RepID=Q4J8J0_SULAC|nr:1-(5-phosphoribosyl)-5-((5-phosphoribosylamino)methylideneamino)imidazole-4-carboxamide isomerase [Sulfolobus acidocaldarius]AAY80889.1 1-(5-phosphoribosyl)-5-[(5-phosphoribosylamino)methylideneamino] imidazole-4-carboxamide isomerase [Sulfolobus acidocaldarius DSM 639]AGE71489.1 1-(5-phosphoribosyl)-5-[(5-phosphoribosylamino)methylideneamino] imidazole-4-carboxamide isomerase [Sulfolobus acidocaldarius N8]AGE73762.1 1-(5-phosphoribosyl)-5-[(5-phosphoribosylamino)methylideneamino] imidazole-4
MKVMPSIDISNKVAVKRIRGKGGSGIILGDPLKIAKEIISEGYDAIHIVDLDAAEGLGDNKDIIKQICTLGFSWTQVGGGVRKLEIAKDILEYCSSIVVSTLPITNRQEYDKIISGVGVDKVFLSIDYDDNGYVLIKGWKEKSVKVSDLLDLESGGVIFTYIPNEGTKGGIDNNVVEYVKSVKKIKEYAGGIGSLDDLLKLKSFGFDYSIIGMSFYNGTLRGIRFV